MCFGMRCGKERQDTGTCLYPSRCVLEDIEEAEDVQNERYEDMGKSLNCPSCDKKGLDWSGSVFFCSVCGDSFTAYDMDVAEPKELEGAWAW